jgi:hypothetical protein
MKTVYTTILVIALLLLSTDLLAQESVSADSDNYPIYVCEDCNYVDLAVSEMYIIGLGMLVLVDTPSDFFVSLSELPARDIWLGYENGGFDMPSDVKIMYMVDFRVSENLIPGPLMYQGEVLPELLVVDDRALVIFWESESSEEIFVFPFRSLTRTCTAQGEHCGEHLLGAYAVPSESVDELFDAYR